MSLFINFLIQEIPTEPIKSVEYTTELGKKVLEVIHLFHFWENLSHLHLIFRMVLIIPTTMRKGVQRRHDPHKNDLRASGFAELPPGPAKLVSQSQWRPQVSRHSVSTPRILVSACWFYFLFKFIGLTKQISKYISS